MVIRCGTSLFIYLILKNQQKGMQEKFLLLDFENLNTSHSVETLEHPIYVPILCFLRVLVKIKKTKHLCAINFINAILNGAKLYRYNYAYTFG